jgi:hypothetical protein
MRSKRNRKPRWNMLNLIILLAVGGLALEHRLHLTPTGHTIVLILIVVILYGLMGLWVQSNATALEDLDAEDYRTLSRDPSVYGTPEIPTRTQSDFRETVLYYRHESPDQRERL